MTKPLLGSPALSGCPSRPTAPPRGVSVLCVLTHTVSCRPQGLKPNVTSGVEPWPPEPGQDLVLDVRQENNAPATSMLIRAEPEMICPSQRPLCPPLAAGESCFSPGPATLARPLSHHGEQAGPPIASLRHSGALCAWGLRLPGAGRGRAPCGGQEKGSD